MYAVNSQQFAHFGLMLHMHQFQGSLFRVVQKLPSSWAKYKYLDKRISWGYQGGNETDRRNMYTHEHTVIRYESLNQDGTESLLSCHAGGQPTEGAWIVQHKIYCQYNIYILSIYIHRYFLISNYFIYINFHLALHQLQGFLKTADIKNIITAALDRAPTTCRIMEPIR